MNRFKRLFQRNNSSAMSDSNQIPMGSTPDNFEELFVDANPPSEDLTSEGNKLNAFVNNDFSSKGYNDGYLQHSKEMLDLNIKSMKAEFRTIVDEIIDQKKSRLHSIRNHIIATEGISTTLERQLNNSIQEIEDCIVLLEKEKELSVSDEGLFMKPFYNYRIGFIKGLDLYQEEKLFCQSTGIFN